MKKTVLGVFALFLVFFLSGCQKESPTPLAQQEQNTPHDIRIFSANNSDGAITIKGIEKAFEANGFTIAGNNNMNLSFEARFGGGKDYEIYRLLFVYNPKITAKILKDYPEFGLLAPLSTSVYSKDGSKISISSLSLSGMSRISGVPMNNPDLITLHESMTKALREAFPKGAFEALAYKIIRPEGELVTRFAFEMENDFDDIDEAKYAYQEIMEGEIESAGFVVAGFIPIMDDLVANGVENYEFYDGYSLCKLEVIYPVHKKYPEVGAFAPCTMYMYKKKDEALTRMGYSSVYNWIKSTNIDDDESLDPLIDAQNLLESTIDSTIE
ncbi:MAG: DUF302 domain-containing protein [Campylobacterales bacterium]|nr:DUF302 domain-containing protein [Campylobacterales bacterium]